MQEIFNHAMGIQFKIRLIGLESANTADDDDGEREDWIVFGYLDMRRIFCDISRSQVQSKIFFQIQVENLKYIPKAGRG